MNEKVILKYITIVLLIKCLNILACKEFYDVTLNQGVVSGKQEITLLTNRIYYAFRGIPYAEPPVGELRFLPPLSHKGWEGTLQAHETRETCMQYSGRMRNSEPFGISGSEDCLYISIYTPSLDESLPVIVFDYNDHFRTSFNGTKTYLPDYFMDNNAIIVTISHRLGLFGYLSTEDDVLPGNAGLKDYILGLKWIKNNIKHFGGNPEKITLMGSRGGAAIADILLYSEKATGLFSGVIIQSGTSLESIYFRQNSRRNAFSLGEAVNVTTDDSKQLLHELQKLKPEDLLLKEADIVDTEETRTQQMSVLLFTPIVEHDHSEAVLKSLPDDSEVVNDVPIIAGFNSREGIDLVSHYIARPGLVIETDKEFLMHFPIRSRYKFNRESALYNQAIREIKDFYFTHGEFTVYNLLEYADYVGDMLQIYAMDTAVKKLSKGISSPIFYYMFDFRGAFNENLEFISRNAVSSIGNWGATITDELCYLFICNRIRKKYKEIFELPSEQREMKLMRKMIRMWVNFASVRNPTPKDDESLKGLYWEPVGNSANKKYLHISKTQNMKLNPISDRIDFWDNFLAKYSRMAIDGVVSDRDEL